jgi:hypothetical protein
MSAKWTIQIMKIIRQLRLILMDMSHRLMTYTMQLIPKIISNILHCGSPYMLKQKTYLHMTELSIKSSDQILTLSKIRSPLGLTSLKIMAIDLISWIYYFLFLLYVKENYNFDRNLKNSILQLSPLLGDLEKTIFQNIQENNDSFRLRSLFCFRQIFS